MLTRTRKNKSIPFGLSLPGYLLTLIDIERGDVTRSRFILRMLEENIIKDKRSKNSLKVLSKKVASDSSLNPNASTGDDYSNDK
ncbi:MAG: hypothetical protein R2685_09840 [Candidatus Nitrosocosmicus sp.]|nr:hypothetical protein [Candidatus Nitrosocosmicus sp.]